MQESLGKYLKRLREAQQLSLREASKRAGVSSGYLSQVEGEKRGRRKGGQVFAPHPELIMSLARVYHVPAADVLMRAGYLGPQERYSGFYEDVEITRCFEFVLHDPALKEVFTTDEKTAIVRRYETLTGRKLITWAGDDLVVNAKATFAGLRLEGGLLYASRTMEETLTSDEVRQELGITVDELKHLITRKMLRPAKSSKGNLLFHTSEVLSHKRRWLDIGRKVFLSVKEIPRTAEQLEQAKDEVFRRRQEASANKYRKQIEKMILAQEQHEQKEEP